MSNHPDRQTGVGKAKMLAAFMKKYARKRHNNQNKNRSDSTTASHLCCNDGSRAFLITMSQLVDQRLLSEGIAFFTIGFVGILMSWTTMDIGAGIKEAIHEVGQQNQRAIAESNQRFDKTLNRIAESQKDIAESQKDIAKVLDNVTKSQERMHKSQDDIKDTIKNKD